MQTSRISEFQFQRARQRLINPSSDAFAWQACGEELRRLGEEFFVQGVTVYEYDSSWYDPDEPYVNTYVQFHKYINEQEHETLFKNAVQQMARGILFEKDEWRRQAVEITLKNAENINFDVGHYDAGMIYSWISWPLCDVALGASDLLSDDEKSRLQILLRRAADAMLRNNELWRTELSRMAFNNHRICHMAVLLALSKVLEDPSISDPIFDPTDDRSYQNYLDGCMYDDGICYESSLLYHYATTNYLCYTAEVQHALYSERTSFFALRGAYGRSLHDMIRAPFLTCFLNGERPRVGDSYGASMLIDGKPVLFTIAHGVYDDHFLGQLSQGFELEHPLHTLMWAADDVILEKIKKPSVQSRIFPEHGYALLRDEGKHIHQAFLTGDRSGIHHQRDTLQLQVAIDNDIILACNDVRPTASHSFSDTIHESFNRWAHAHSQLQVDELDQKLHNSPIPIREWLIDDNASEVTGQIKRMAMVDEQADIYDDIHQGRFVSIHNDFICDAVIAASKTEHQWRLFYHLPAGAAESEHIDSSEACTYPDENPWKLFKSTGKAAANVWHSWRSGSAQFKVATQRPAELFRFDLDYFGPQGQGVYVQQYGQDAVFISVMSMQGLSCEIEDLQLFHLGPELCARWFVHVGNTRHALQARILRPGERL